MLAMWSLDETTGPRYNRQGNTARNLTETGGAFGNITDHMEGTNAITPSWSHTLTTGDNALAKIAAPFTCGAWLQIQYDLDRPFEATSDGSTNGFSIVGHVWNWNWTSYGGTANVGTNVSGGVWQHLAWKMAGGAVQAYLNGKTSGAAVSGTYVTPTGTAFVVGPHLNGPIDEMWCASTALADTSVCRICSCGVRGELCTCSGTSYTTNGRNSANCQSCTLPACNAATPP